MTVCTCDRINWYSAATVSARGVLSVCQAPCTTQTCKGYHHGHYLFFACLADLNPQDQCTQGTTPASRHSQRLQKADAEYAGLQEFPDEGEGLSALTAMPLLSIHYALQCLHIPAVVRFVQILCTSPWEYYNIQCINKSWHAAAQKGASGRALASRPGAAGDTESHLCRTEQRCRQKGRGSLYDSVAGI